MQAKLTFDLPEDKEEFILASRGQDSWAALFDMDEWLRNQIKYGHTFYDADEALDEARKQIQFLMEEKGVSIDMVS